MEWSRLEAAVLGNDTQALVKVLKRKQHLPIDTLTSANRTLLYTAASRGYHQVSEALLRKGRADPNLATPLGFVALHVAAELGHDLVAKVLLEDDRTDPNVRAQHGQTPLYQAALSGQVRECRTTSRGSP